MKNIEKKILEEFDERFEVKGSSAIKGLDKLMIEYNKEIRDFISKALKEQRAEIIQKLKEKMKFKLTDKDEYCAGSFKKLIMKLNRTEKFIEVCDKCKRASCWYGEFMCDMADCAGTIKLPISELEKLGLEDKVYWSDKKLLEVYGQLSN